MIDKRMHDAMDLRLSEADKARLWQQIAWEAEEDAPPVQEVQNMRKRNMKNIVRISLIAAVIASLMAVGAYASGFLGRDAILIDEPDPSDGSALVSITQPQAAPEEMDEVSRKIENAKAAWAEWRTWRETSPDLPHEPAVFLPPENNISSTYVDKPDGGYTIYFNDNESIRKAMDATPEGAEPDLTAFAIEVRTATAEEAAQEKAFHEYVQSEYGDYDFNYDIHIETEAKKLEEIAAKYGLALRHGSTLLWCKESVEEMDAEMNAAYGTDIHTDTSDPRFLSKAELCDRISGVACHGDLFRTDPHGFDKVYYFDEGSFCVSFSLDSGDKRLNCYGYNSVYSTLSSGREVLTRIQDPAKLQTRTHTAPDGTELTVLQGENEAFLYVYLGNSFFEEHIHCDVPLTDADVDLAADALIYSNIGKVA